MNVFLAIDAGGTKTQCWVADESRVLADVTGGTVKLMSVGEEEATGRLRELMLNAISEAGVAPEQVTRAVMGLAGSSSEAVRTWAKRTVASVVSCEFLLSGDEEIALDAAFQGGPGILVIAGTGSNTVGRCADGRTVSAGGWGPMIGDEGSGHWIGVEALRAAFRAHDRGVDTCLLHRIQAFWKLGSLGDLVAYANARNRPAFAELTMLIAECAAGGDALAQSVLQRAGEELAASVSLVASKMTALGCVSQGPLQVAFTGSVLGKISAVRAEFVRNLQTSMPGAVVREDAVLPLEGALWRARSASRN